MQPVARKEESPVVEVKITIYSIAKALGLSPSMVSRAFTPGARIDEGKRQLVLQYAESVGYRPNKLASRLSHKAVRIGVLLVCPFDPVTNALLKGCRLAHDRIADYKVEYHVVTVTDFEDAYGQCKAALDSFSACDGVIVSVPSTPEIDVLIIEFAQKNPNIAALQQVNMKLPYVFTVKHNESVASGMAAELIYRCVKPTDRRDVALFTGYGHSDIHIAAKKGFEEACARLGLHIAATYDMQDTVEILESQAEALLRTRGDSLGGIYITSAVSEPLCRRVKESRLPINLVTFDTFPDIVPYLRDGTVVATIFQNIVWQAETAFLTMAEMLISNHQPTHRIQSIPTLVLSENLALYEGQC